MRNSFVWIGISIGLAGLTATYAFATQPDFAACESALRSLTVIGDRIRQNEATQEDISQLPALLDRLYDTLDQVRIDTRRFTDRATDSGFGVKGVGNKLAMDMHLEQLHKKLHPASDPVGVIHLDLDGLKAINDLGGGHHGGDAVIAEVLKALSKTLRESDDVAIFRPSGDEVVILVRQGWRIQDIANRVERTLAAVDVPPLKEVAKQLRKDPTLQEAKLRDSTSESREELLRKWEQGHPSITGAVAQSNPAKVYTTVDDMVKDLWAADAAVARLKRAGGRGRIHRLRDFIYNYSESPHPLP